MGLGIEGGKKLLLIFMEGKTISDRKNITISKKKKKSVLPKYTVHISDNFTGPGSSTTVNKIFVLEMNLTFFHRNH